MKYTRAIIGILFFFFATGCYRTVYVHKLPGVEEINATDTRKKTIVIVRIPTHGGKIRYLKKMIAIPGTPLKSVQTFHRQLDEAIQADKEYYGIVYSGFKRYFNWSEVLFVPDTLYKEFSSGKIGVFLDESGMIDSRIKTTSDYLLISTPNNTDQLILTDKTGIRLPKPYPYKKNTFLPVFKRIFSKKKYIHQQIMYFNEKLSATQQ